MSKRVNRVQTVRALAGMVVEVQFAGGQTVRVDMSETADRLAVFAPLKKRAVFRRVHVADWGHGIEWDDDAALSADRVMEMALEQAGRADTLAFRHWQDRNGLSLAQAAEAIGITRRTVSQYRTGTRPVPRYIELAVKGWEVEQRHARTVSHN